jgi:hypothetical protein
MDSFGTFIGDRKADLARIARATRGEHSVGDVANEAWVLAIELSERHSNAADFCDPQFQSLLLSHLFQRLVRFTELNVRHGVRLDHPANGSDGEGSHPLIDRLADTGEDPLQSAITAHERAHRAAHEPNEFSLAAAYLTLLRRFDNRMRSLAGHLLISLSHAYRCCEKARWLAAHQRSVAWAPADPSAAVRPWRTGRTERIPRQLQFDFENKFPFSTPAVAPVTSSQPA